MTLNADRIQKDILKYIQRYAISNSQVSSQRDFNKLALELFAYQFRTNQPYRQFAQQQRRTPLTVKTWTEIPLMPIRGFKWLTLSTTPITPGEPVFMSSGTTDPQHRSRNYHPSFKVWDASMRYPFKQYVLPDRDQITILGLFPGAQTNPNSSLSRYVNKAIEFFGTADSKIFVDEHGMDYYGLEQALTRVVDVQKPVLLLGASFAYVHLLDHLQNKGLHYQLPKGSILFDTGGFKGQSREIALPELLTAVAKTLGIGQEMYINMYGMTEISSQCYDQNLYTAVHHLQVTAAKQAPAWVRVRILDPDTLQPVAKGQPGLIAYYDLANWNSCMAILTEDQGIQKDEGFCLLGRVAGAAAKGCSIAVDQLLASQTQ